MAENKITNKATEWTPNPTQSRFLKALAGEQKPLTLKEISEKLGVELKSGSINCLVTKGLVVTEDVEVVEVVKRKKKVKAYHLAKKEE